MQLSKLIEILFYFVDQNEKVENIKISVEKAKEAVQYDVKDGTSWCKLLDFFCWVM